MNVRQHATLARALQDDCGGADKCVDLLEPTPFKMGRTHIYACRAAGSGRTMPIGAVVFLELHSGRRIYSPVVAQAAPPPTDAECAVSEACELNETSGQLQRMIRLAAEDDVFTEHEKREIEPVLQSIEARVNSVRAAMDQGAAS